MQYFDQRITYAGRVLLSHYALSKIITSLLRIYQISMGNQHISKQYRIRVVSDIAIFCA